MPKFIAVSSKGLGPSLAEELKGLSLKVLEQGESNVTFDSNWAGCYKANLRSRVATGILLPVLDFPAYQPEDIYNNAIKKHDFTKYFRSIDDTFTIQATTSDSKLRDQRLVAMTLKDAIVDQCYKKWDARPSIDNAKPKIIFSIRIFKNNTSIAVVTNGASLSQRGYRTERTEAPLREHLAAGLIQLTDWDGEAPIVDLMCGSGTFLIEAALMKRGVSPGVDRGAFAFQHYPSFDEEAFQSSVDEALEAEKEVDIEEPMFFGFDISSKALDIAKRNAQRAEVDDMISFARVPVSAHKQCPTEKKGIVLVNPPYGKRLDDLHTIQDIYRDLAFILKRQFTGWTAWILSGDKSSTAALGLKNSKSYTVYNGGIECRWLRYEIR